MFLLVLLNPTDFLFTSFLGLCIYPSLLVRLSSLFLFLPVTLRFPFFLQEPCGICPPMNH